MSAPFSSTHHGSDTECKHVKQLWILVKILTLEVPVDDFFNSQKSSKSTATDASFRSLLCSLKYDSETGKW
jgi:hypothetical protein